MRKSSLSLGRGLGLLLLLSAVGTQAQIYRPPAGYGMWDTWLLRAGGQYQLFFLQSSEGLTWNTIGRAVSSDLLHWQALPPIPTNGPPGAWDEPPTLTGCTVRQDGRYVLFYGSAAAGQPIGAMFSPDLLTWEKYPGNPLLTSRPPYYGGEDWRDMCAVFSPAEGLWHGYVCARTAGEPALAPLGDKTLVAWVRLGSTTQRGGGVISLAQVGTPAFDSLTFGEIAPGRWMAGSEYYQRTAADQAAWPEETAGPQELLQVAVVYQGHEVRLYRNGELYAQHSVANPMVFGGGTQVVLGLRDLATHDGFLLGSVDEARLYDYPLTAAELGKLRPDPLRELRAPAPPTVESGSLLGEDAQFPDRQLLGGAHAGEPRPLAQWTFEGGSLQDEQDHFPALELHGGARVEDGQLVLDGQSAYAATPARGGAACVAHLTSTDLLHWNYLPPVLVDAGFNNMEVPDYFSLGGKHYLLFSSVGTRRDTGGRLNATGTWYAVADRAEGPYRVLESCLLLGSGRGRWDSYVGRTIPWGDTRLLYSHTTGGEVTWGVPKLVRQRTDGSLGLAYWPDLSKLETHVLQAGCGGLSTVDVTGPGVWSLLPGEVRGRASGSPAVLWLPVSAGDFMLTCRVNPGSARRAGLAWRWTGERGGAVVLERASGTVVLGEASLTDQGLTLGLVDDVRRPRLERRSYHLRVMARAHRVEVYLDDEWLFSTTLGDGAAGRVGLWVEGGTAQFTDLRLAAIEPLP